MLGSSIIDLVIAKMEEYSPFSTSSDEHLLAGGDVLQEIKPVYSYIHAHLSEAADEMLKMIPIHRLSTIKKDGIIGSFISVDKDDSSIGTIEKQSDWLRLHTLQLIDWTRPIHTVVHPDEPIYTLQFNRWTRGTPQKPIVTDDGQYLHYYSTNISSPVRIRKYSYISSFTESTDYPRDVAELIALNTARKVYEIYGNTEQGSAMTNELKVVLENMKL